MVNVLKYLASALNDAEGRSLGASPFVRCSSTRFPHLVGPYGDTLIKNVRPFSRDNQ